ncbi:MAG: hypothetical protein U1E70_01705 [Acetobacteraceae bacterium]
MTIDAYAALHAVTGDGDPDGIAMLQGVINDLAPLFVSDPEQRDAGRRMALRAVLRHRPVCEADFLSAAQAVAHGRVSLTLIRDAADPATAPAERRQLISQAQQASRTANQMEAAMQRRRKLAQAEARSAEPQRAEPPPGVPGGSAHRGRSPNPVNPAQQSAAPPRGPEAAPTPPFARDPAVEAMMQFAHRIIAEAALGAGSPADDVMGSLDASSPALEEFLAPWLALGAGADTGLQGAGSLPPLADAAD